MHRINSSGSQDSLVTILIIKTRIVNRIKLEAETKITGHHKQMCHNLIQHKCQCIKTIMVSKSNKITMVNLNNTMEWLSQRFFRILAIISKEVLPHNLSHLWLLTLISFKNHLNNKRLKIISNSKAYGKQIKKWTMKL